MTRLARLPLAAGVLLFALACHSDSLTPPTGGPLAAFSDGAHEGNPDFFFLPPLFKSPSSNPNFEPGAFNPNVKPVVEICELSAAFTCVAGPPLRRFETAELRLTDQHYQVNWRTDESNLTLTSYYRIMVIVGTDTLGFADVDPVGTGRELRSVETGEYIGLVDGRTLPIRFRIENGALCDGSGPCTSRTIALNAPGGNVIVLEGTGDQVTIPQQASGQVVTVTLQLCNDGEGNLTSIDVDLRRLGNCVRVTTDPSLEEALSPKARVDICSLIGEVPDLPGEQEHLITLHRQDGEVIRALPHAYGDVCSGLSSAPVPGLRGLAAAGWRWVRRNVAALVTPRPLHARAVLLDVGELGGLTDGFSDFQLALPAKMVGVEGTDGQTAEPGTPVENPPAVFVSDLNGQAVAGATVRFVVTAGGGTVNLGSSVPCGSDPELSCVLSDVNGFASVASWTLGSLAGTNMVTASGRGIAAQNNFDGAVRPFMPDIDDGEGDPLTAVQREAQVPVLLQTGEVLFSATGVPPMGSLAFIQQPTNTVSGEAISPALQIRVLDPSGEPLGEIVRVTVGNDPNNPETCQVLQTSQLALDGVATFSNVIVNGTCTGARVAATAGGGDFDFPIIVSEPFDILSGTMSLSIVPSSTTLAIGGPNISYVATITNGTGATQSNVGVQAWIDQGSATRAAGGTSTSCGALGVVPTGTCTFSFSYLASNSTGGSGTLVAGSATARFELQQGETVIGTITFPVTLTTP